MRSFIIVITSSSERPQTLTLKTMSNIELLHGFGLQLMASLSLPLSLLQILTALDRDGYCRKHKLRHKLEQAINLMSGSS